MSSDPAVVPAKPRDSRLDALRGVAIVLMVLDHSLAVAMTLGAPSELHWLRNTVTRLSLPLFMIVSGLLLQRRSAFSARRTIPVLYCAIFVNCFVLAIPVGLNFPDILALWLFAVALSRVILRFPVETLTLGLLQTASLPITYSLWTNYQPGWVVAWVALGVLVARLDEPAFLRHADKLPGWLAAVGRRPLLWYVGHIALLLVVGGLVLANNPEMIDGWWAN